MARVKLANFTDTELLDFLESQGNGSDWECDVSWPGARAFVQNTWTRDMDFAGATCRAAIAKAAMRHSKWPLGKPRSGFKSRAKGDRR